MHSNPAVAAAQSRIEALAYLFHNADAEQMGLAALNSANNCPALWHSASGGDAVVGSFMFYLNDTQDVLRAIEAYEAEMQRPCRMREEAKLDKLLPLNDAGAVSLAMAYSEAGTFRFSRELMDRTFRAEDQALDALRNLRNGGGARPALVPLDDDRIVAAQNAVRHTGLTAPVVAGAVRLSDIHNSIIEAA